MPDPDREDLRAQYQAVCNYELTVSRMRFQTLSLFLAAVGFIVGLSDPTQAIGALLLSLSLGLWVIDLRSRSLLNRYREMGEEIERQLLGEDALLFSKRSGRDIDVTFGILNAKWKIRGDQRGMGLVAFQVGFDFLFFAVMGYGVWLLIDQSGWLQLLALGPIVLAALAVLLFWPYRVKP